MMIMTQTTGGSNKRDVVDGQFEDPEDPVEEPPNKRQKKAQMALSMPTSTESAVVPTGFFPGMPHPAMMASGLAMNPVLMAQWHQQQAQMMRMFAMMPPAMMQGKGILLPSTPQLLPIAPQRQLPKDNEWRIPFSHNYHPAKGFINPPTLSTANNANMEKEGGSKEPSSASILQPPKSLPSLDLDSAKPLKFPLIQADKARAFGIGDDELTRKDVLCGRGGLTNTHPGNVHYRELVDQYRWHYGTCKKSRKSEIAKIIVGKVRDMHGRFLKKDGDNWYEIGDELALQKTSQTLREGLAKIYREGLKSKMSTSEDDAEG